MNVDLILPEGVLPPPFAAPGGADLRKRILRTWERFLKDPELGDPQGAFPEGVRRLEVSLSFRDRASMAELNRDYRGVEGPTDVLSFPLWEEEGRFLPPPWEDLPLGDLVVCPEEVEPLEGSLDRGMLLVVHHGFLHLLGWDHDTSEKEARMWALQDRFLRETLEDGLPAGDC